MGTKEIQKLVGKMQVLKFHSPVCENVKDALSICEFDILSVSKSKMVYEFEIKISRSDFLADRKKPKHIWYSNTDITKYTPNFFSYACPKDLIKVNEIGSGVGLYYINEVGEIIEVQAPKKLHSNVHDIQKLNAKINRLMSERHFLGCARQTYENSDKLNRNKKILLENQQLTDY